MFFRGIKFNLPAGRDTTACLLTWSLYEISKHPEMEQKILDEMKQVFSDAPVSAESVKGLKYTHNFLSEVLRLHPPVLFCFFNFEFVPIKLN